MSIIARNRNAVLNPPKPQRGVALVTAILMVAIATALATKMVWDNSISVRRTESVLSLEQAKQLALGAEAVAVSILIERGPDFGNYAQDIQEPIIYEANIDDVSLGVIQGQLIDLQGRFNVNNLIMGGTVDAEVKNKFGDLLELLRLDRGLADLIADWIDSDSVPQGAGAEDGSYTSLDPPYRPANNYLTDISELRAVGGINKETYEILLPHVTALPPGWCGSSRPTPVNLNFASAPVIAAIAGIPLATANTLAELRDETPWETVDDIALPPDADPRALAYIDVKTGCFALSVIVDVGSSTLTMYSLLDRASSVVQVIPRVRAYGLEN